MNIIQNGKNKNILTDKKKILYNIYQQIEKNKLEVINIDVLFKLGKYITEYLLSMKILIKHSFCGASYRKRKCYTGEYCHT